MKKKQNKTPHQIIMGLKDPLQLFDMVCAHNYFKGTYDLPIPVDESREAFERIKELLR